MSFLPSFLVWPFAIAGLICAAGPIIIHLLNRRRYRVVPWAAMEFLREAMRRNRRILQLRDLLLLLLRTAAVLLVGLALAQPFFAQKEESFDNSKPLHAVVLIDNSLSMGYQSLDGTLLDRAKARAKQYFDKLPVGSRVSVIPVCGSRWGYSPDAYTKENAVEAVERIEVVDRSANVQQAVNEARKALASGPMLGKRVVLFSDQQVVNWQGLGGPDQFADLPSFQVVDISAPQWENTWISAFELQDGLADIETPTTFVVRVRHQGPTPRQDLPVTLFVDNVEVAAKTVTVEPGEGAREVTFEHVFNTYRPEPNRPVSVPVRVALAPDRLPADDERHLVVPVVAALPVVFADQYSAGEEDKVRKRLGETRPLRKAIAPVISRADSPRQLVKIRHVRFDTLEQETLADARLVVVGGIADPSAKVALLREYVVQGGQLIIAAGGASDPATNAGFDPDKWTTAAWLDGAGILPAPLKPDFLGGTPDEKGPQLRPFFLSYESLQTTPYFRLPGYTDDELRDWYSDPFFFKAVQVDLGDDILAVLQESEVQRREELDRLRAQVATRDRPLPTAASSPSGSPSGDDRRADEERLRELQPTWLVWSQAEATGVDEPLPEEPAVRKERLAELAQAARPRVLARFNDPGETPFLVERAIGQGTVVLITTGLQSDWNTLADENAMFLFKRLTGAMIRATLPPRNFPPQERIALPLPTSDRDVAVTLQRPGTDPPEVLDTGFIGTAQLGLIIPRPLARGTYRVVATRRAGRGSNGPPEVAWELPLAVNGPAPESELAPLDQDAFETRFGSGARWVATDEEISLAGSQIRGQDAWWWLILVVLALLVLELFVLATPLWRREVPAVQQA